MDAGKGASVFQAVFSVGLGLGVLVSLNFRYGFLPDDLGGFLPGVAACCIVGGGTLKHVMKDREKRKEP